ncbi:TetR/AcrR family transcriptional regulator [Cellulomonas endophytica]|uniref:TetR/AcrR family transcriptional regulator n=1 Tax=Cellulomonas endophytica TaxID=2494735 RepID=UPI00196B2C22|nr:TetR/AcrR family transcriptional regulator [Cellulomonas endophytica]
MSTTAARPLRADARRNRERLLAVAARMLAADEAVALEAIAQEAGVGIGTLYRHFPQRALLLEAAYRHEVEALCDAAPELVASAPTGMDALRAWTDRFVGYAATKRGMGGALRAAVGPDAPLFTETRERLVGALETLVGAGQADGTVRPDIAADDVLRAVGAVWMVPDGPEWDAQVRRLLDLVVDGLRHGAPRGRVTAPTSSPTL